MTRLPAFAVIGLLRGARARGADNPAPAVDSANLAAFLEKWKTSKASNFPSNETEHALLLAALAKDPADPRYAYLATQSAED